MFQESYNIKTFNTFKSWIIFASNFCLLLFSFIVLLMHSELLCAVINESNVVIFHLQFLILRLRKEIDIHLLFLMCFIILWNFGRLKYNKLLLDP